MKKTIYKIFSLFVAIIVLFSIAVPSVGAISYTNDVKTTSDSILLVNMDIDQPVFEKNADTKRYPASTTKIMTYIIAVENIDDLDNTRIEIKQSVLDTLEGTGSSLANVANHVGDTMSAIDLLYSMMVPSGNDAAMVLADYVGGGDVDKFVEMMNNKAKELGCENTHFSNPDGLHNPEHYTTARDLYKITKYALTMPRFSEITNTTTYTCEGEDYPLVTTNYLIDANRGGKYYYKYAKGIKTGSTDQAGRCLVTTASADGYSYMAVLLHSPYKEGETTDYGTMTDAADLFRWALTKLELEQVATSTMPVCEQKVELAWGRDSVQLVPEKNITAIVPKTISDSDLVVETDIPESVDAPVEKGQKIGTESIYYQNPDTGEKQLLTKVNLVSSEKIERSGILFVLDVIQTLLKSYWFILLIGLIVLLLIIYFIYAKISSRKNRKNRNVKNYRNF